MIWHRYLLAVEFTSDILYTWIELMKLDGSWKFIAIVIFSTLVEWLTLSTCTMGVWVQYTTLVKYFLSEEGALTCNYGVSSGHTEGKKILLFARLHSSMLEWKWRVGVTTSILSCWMTKCTPIIISWI